MTGLASLFPTSVFSVPVININSPSDSLSYRKDYASAHIPVAVTCFIQIRKDLRSLAWPGAVLTPGLVLSFFLRPLWLSLCVWRCQVNSYCRAFTLAVFSAWSFLLQKSVCLTPSSSVSLKIASFQRHLPWIPYVNHDFLPIGTMLLISRMLVYFFL